jgi:hypothetical protein
MLLLTRVSGNHSRMNWPHGPAHWLFEPGLFMITAGTYEKLPHLSSPLRLDFLRSLFDYAGEFEWNLRAWALLPNHYHFVAVNAFKIDKLNVPDDF